MSEVVRGHQMRNDDWLVRWGLACVARLKRTAHAGVSDCSSSPSALEAESVKMCRNVGFIVIKQSYYHEHVA
jgi:hypothetical protein